MINPVVKKWVFASAIAINTILFPISLVTFNSMSMAGVNFLSGLLCWLGYYIALNEIEKSKEE